MNLIENNLSQLDRLGQIRYLNIILRHASAFVFGERGVTFPFPHIYSKQFVYMPLDKLIEKINLLILHANNDFTPEERVQGAILLKKVQLFCQETDLQIKTANFFIRWVNNIWESSGAYRDRGEFLVNSAHWLVRQKIIELQQKIAEVENTPDPFVKMLEESLARSRPTCP